MVGRGRGTEVVGGAVLVFGAGWEGGVGVVAAKGVDDALDVDAETVLGRTEGEGGDAAEGFVGRDLLLVQLCLLFFWG